MVVGIGLGGETVLEEQGLFLKREEEEFGGEGREIGREIQLGLIGLFVVVVDERGVHGMGVEVLHGVVLCLR